MVKDYYKILELDEEATREEIEEAYQKKKQTIDALNSERALAELEEARDNCLADQQSREQEQPGLQLKPTSERIAHFLLEPDAPRPHPRPSADKDFVEDRSLLKNPKIKEEFEEVNWLINSKQWGENVKAIPGLYNGQPIILITIAYKSKAELDNILGAFKEKGFDLKPLTKLQPQNPANNPTQQPSPTPTPRPWPPTPKPTPKDPTQI